MLEQNEEATNLTLALSLTHFGKALEYKGAAGIAITTH